MGLTRKKESNYLKSLKLLKFRREEIINGKIKYSIYGDKIVNGVLLKNIKSISEVGNLWKTQVDLFTENTINNNNNENILFEIKNLGDDFDKEVLRLKNNYYNTFDLWGKLNFMQFLINYEEHKKYEFGPYNNSLFHKFNGIDIVTRQFIEDYAIKHSEKYSSIFTSDCTIRYFRPRVGLIEKRDHECEKAKAAELYKKINEISIGSNSSIDFVVENFHISDKYQLIWLNDNRDKAIEIKNLLGGSTSTSNPIFISKVLPMLKQGAATAKLIEELGLLVPTTHEEWEERAFLYNNQTEANELIKFANENRVDGVISDEAKKFINLAIKSIKDTSNYIDSFEEFKVYYCDCFCDGSEVEFIDDLTNNMEPKWGQLANKEEVLTEINSIPNLSSLTFENQILALESHFNKNINYRRVNGALEISNPGDSVNKYIYTEIAGWLDFHHVFKLFKWAKNRGVIGALPSGEMGEVYQWLRNNHSAYSYEDLPSNRVGVAIFIRFGRRLESGSISWKEAIGQALDEMKWVVPEKAPNYD